MQIEMIIGVAGLLLLAAVVFRGSLAIAAFTFHQLRAHHRDRQSFKELLEQVAPAPHPDRPPSPTRPAKADPPAPPGSIRLVVAKRVIENQAGDICSFYLTSADRSPLPLYKPGQHLTVTTAVPGTTAQVSRSYSLSTLPTDPQEFYRVSIKRLNAGGHTTSATHPGLLSSFFHDQMREGAIINAMPPAGSFCLDEAPQHPIVLIAGGIGITPLLSILDWLSAVQFRHEVWLFYGVRNSAEHAFRDHLRSLSRNLPHLRLVVFYSQPTAACRLGADFHEAGHVRVSYMQQVLKARDYTFYLCGPSSMMHAIRKDLLLWGVPEAAIKAECFGAGPPAKRLSLTGMLKNAATFSPSRPRSAPANKLQIKLTRTNRQVSWTGRQASLLELAEACGIRARHSCRAGQCGTCKVALRSGQVEYISEPALAPEDGTCLPCITRPATDLEIDL